MTEMKYTISNEGIKLYNYRWVIIACMFVVHCCLNGALLILGGAALNVMAEFELDPQGFSLCMSVSFLTGAILGIPSGTLADRIGIRKVMILGLIIATIGAVWRVFAVDFWTLFSSSFVMGVALAALNANSAKLLRLWFPGRFMSVGMGIYVAGATVGSATAIACGQFVDIHAAFIVLAILLAVCVVIWIVFCKPYPDGEGGVKEPVLEHIGVVCRSKGLWITCLLMFLIMGLSLTENGFQVAALTSPAAAGGLAWDPVLAATLTSATNVCVSIGGVIIPAIAARINRVKPVFIPAAFAMAMLVAIAWFCGNPIVTFICFLCQGVLMGGVIPIGKTLPGLLPDIRPEHMGAAGGLQSTCQNLGAFIVPSYIVTPLAGNNFTSIFIGVIVLCVLIGLVGFAHKETGATPAHDQAD